MFKFPCVKNLCEETAKLKIVIPKEFKGKKKGKN